MDKSAPVLELNLAARDLLKMDLFGKSGVFAVYVEGRFRFYATHFQIPSLCISYIYISSYAYDMYHIIFQTMKFSLRLIMPK